MSREEFKKAFAPLHASEEVLLEVTQRMNKEKQTFRRRGRTGLVAALAAVLVLTMTVTFGEDIAAFFTSRLEPVTIEAAEAILGGFCGDISTDAPYMTDKFGNEVVSGPVMEKIAMGDAAVATLVEGYLYDVEAAPIVYEEYTYTLEQFIVDDKGMGLLAYTIENPNGVEYLEHGYGQVSVPLSPYLTTGAPFMDGEHADAYSYRLESSTETKLRLVMFFGTFREYSGEDFYFCITCDDEETEKVIPVGAIQLAPENLVPSTVFTDDCGNTVSLSPMGISTDWQQDYELLTYKLLLHHTDGTYTVKDEECNIYNARVGYWIAADDIGEHLLSSNYLFNCLIDVEAVTEVSLQGYCHPHGGEYTELQRVYVR